MRSRAAHPAPSASRVHSSRPFGYHVETMISRRAALRAGLFAAGALVLPRPTLAKPEAPAPIPPLPITIGVVEVGGVKVRDEAWVEAQMTEAVRLFEPLGVPLRKVAARSLPEAHGRLETRADRDALAALLEPKRINVMIVESLRDVDDPKLLRMGVHWRHRKTPAKHWVIVAASARPSVLAHELGHFFGLPHSSVTDNLMSYDRTGAPPFLDEAQARKVQSFARMYVREKLLLPV
jgi:hypothetical protein